MKQTGLKLLLDLDKIKAPRLSLADQVMQVISPRAYTAAVKTRKRDNQLTARATIESE
jgi:hypothetical protein